ncbi:MAG TPA: HEAT repeat domain-containing protein [Candidatus Polarisedimenticolaceae bacterium]|nr:HEAT repeat domain-containing protein [Candidatus Polarisedimenticolaceae bacterium]
MNAFLPLAFMMSLTSAPNDSTACDELMATLSILRWGSFTERWQLVSDGVPHIQDLLDEDEDLDGCSVQALRTLGQILRNESDDRIVARLMDAIELDCDALDGFAVAALSHPSPNVRRRAAAIVTEDTCERPVVPRLLRMWESEPRSWVLSEVALALASEQDTTNIGQFEELAHDDPGVLGDAALEAVGDLAMPRSVQVIERVADSDGPRAALALSYLGRWIDRPDALKALRRLTLSDNPTVAHAAVAWLAPRAPDPPPKDDEGGSQASVKEPVVTGRTSARLLPVLLQFSAENRELSFGSFALRASDRSRSVRCWEVPGYENPDAIRPRLVDGRSVTAHDVFEWKGEIWYLVMSGTFACWVPESVLVQEGTADATSRPPVEFDIPMTELASPGWRLAERSGFAVTFDESDQVVGVRLSAATGDRDQISWVVDLIEGTEGQLQLGLLIWLRENVAWWSGDEEIMARVAALTHSDD